MGQNILSQEILRAHLMINKPDIICTRVGKVFTRVGKGYARVGKVSTRVGKVPI